MADKKYDLEDRLVNFASDIAVFCKDLPEDMAGDYYANQLLRSGGSSALNFGEAQGTKYKRDYAYRSTICLRELKESRVNLRILDKLEYGKYEQRTYLLNEVDQLIRIIATIIKNKTNFRKRPFPIVTFGFSHIP